MGCKHIVLKALNVTCGWWLKMAKRQLMYLNVQLRVKGLLPTGEVDWCRVGFVTGWSIMNSQNPGGANM